MKRTPKGIMRRISRTKTFSTLVTTAAVGLLWATLATSAEAHPTTAYHGDNYAKIDSSHTHIWVCDKESDGHGVSAEYGLSGGDWRHLGDANGSKSGCGNAYAPAGQEIVTFVICEEDNHCVNGPNP